MRLWMFEMTARGGGLSRIGRLETPHGPVETPALLPVVHPRSLVVRPEELGREFRAPILMTNAYILHRSDVRERVLKEGVHAFLGFEGPVMTDSGAFQQHVYGRVEVSNEEIVRFQAAIGSDLGTALDVFSEPDDDRDRAEESVERTLGRCRAAAKVRSDMGLVGTVQGGRFPDLRTRAAEALSEVELQVHAIGGVVPLLEGYRFADLVDVIVASRRGLRDDRPVHLFGAGHPLVFGLAVLLGCDLFDSAAYAKYAYDGRMLTEWGTRHVEDLAHVDCVCPACVDASPKELGEDVTRLARHNLHVSFREVAAVKQAIRDGSLWEHVERRCRAHPRLLEGLKRLRRHADFLEEYERLSDGSPFYTGPETVWRPAFHRFRRRVLERYRPPEAGGLLVLPEGRKPYRRSYAQVLRDLFVRADAHAVVRTVFGPVPIELDGTYPVGQAVLPDDPDLEAQEAAEAFLRTFLRRGDFAVGLLYEGDESLEELSRRAPGRRDPDPALLRARAVADYQFGPAATDALFDGTVELTQSRRTGKVRNVRVDGAHVLSLRASDGLYTLKLAGGHRLHEALDPPRLRVVVEADSVPFNREGRNVFAKFVADADPALRPWEEALVVDEDDALVAVGRAVLNRREMRAFRRGLAVRVREGSPDV